jgi:superfamily I DNA/RNA helicase
VHLIQWDDLEQEANGLAAYTQTLVAQGVAPGEILVLTPRRQLGYAIRDQIRQREIPVHSFYHEEALEDERAQRAFALLSLLVNLDDRVALRWWLGHDSPSARKNAYSLLRAHCEENGISPREVLDQCIAGTLALNTALTESYRELQSILDGIRPLTLEQLIDKLFPAGDESFAVLREAALVDLLEFETANDLLECVRTNATQPAVPEEADYVRVMSLHKSKGLTSRVAIVSACIQGLIPFLDDTETLKQAAATLKEQRRLFYVAITRCTEKLVVSSAINMRRDLAWKIGAKVVSGRGQVAATIASQFLHELGPQALPAKRGVEWAQAGYAAG